MTRPYDYYRSCYQMIRQRCENPKCRAYPDYGGRGITCYWTDFSSFKDYILTHLGERPDGLSLDRWDNDKGYQPGNLRWATKSMQSANQRSKQRPLGESGYQWVSRHQQQWMGQFSWMRVRYRTKASKEPATAYLQVLALRSLVRP